MRDMMRRAQAYGTLTPGERAVLRLLEGLACTALIAALPIVADALSRQGVNWNDVGRAALAAGVTAALLALSKYLRAQGDPPLTATENRPTATAVVTVATAQSQMAAPRDAQHCRHTPGA